MKTISKIKEATEKKGASDAKVVKTTVKTPSNLRDKQKKDDTALRVQTLLRMRAKALERALDKKSKKLDEINEKIIKKVEESINAGEDIIQEAEKRAKGILKNAGKTKTIANKLLSDAKKLEKDLDAKEKDLKKRSEEIDKDRIDTNNKMITANEREAKINSLLDTTQKKLGQIDDLIQNISALHLVAIDMAGSISDIYNEVIDKVSQNQAKTDKIYKEVQKIETRIKADKRFIAKRAKELDKKEIWIKDRIRTLERSAKEINRKKHG